MSNWINPGDLGDLSRMIRRKGWSWLRKRLRLRARERVQQTWEHMEHGAHWWTIPAVRRRWNEKATGNPDLHYSQYVVETYFPEEHNLQLLSPGCGTATPERRFAATGAFSRIDAFDISENLIGQAQTAAREAGMANRLNLFTADVHRFIPEKGAYNCVLFHSSLHHFKDLEGILDRMQMALKPGGLLIINEYVGPDRLQLTRAQQRTMNTLLATMPARLRRRWPDGSLKRKAWAPGLWRMLASDPSEAVRASEIPGLLRKRFTVLEEKWLGGDLLHLLLKDISHHFTEDDPEAQACLNTLFSAEDAYIQQRGAADFLFGVYRYSSGEAAQNDKNSK